MMSPRPSRRRNPLPCVSLLPLIILLILFNKFLLTPPTILRVTAFSHTPTLPSQSTPTTSPLSVLLLSLITEYNQTSLLSYPCGSLMAVTLPVLSSLPSLSYICEDPDSRRLAAAHAQLSHHSQRNATFRRAKFAKLPLSADVLLTTAVPLDDVRRLLLTARSVDVRFAVLQSLSMPGLPCKAAGLITEFNPIYADAPFPFAHALVGVSDQYGFGEKFLLVYDLSFLPRVDRAEGLTRMQVARDLIRANMRESATEK